MLTAVSGSRTDVGQRRGVNEDSILEDPPLWAVADGMGGHAAGEVASRIVVDALRRLVPVADGLRPSDVQRALEQANTSILQFVGEHPDAAGMGSTVSGIAQVSVGDAGHWAIFNVGDSRVYRCSSGTMTRATVDHSETAEMVLDGLITEDEARTHRLRHVITRAMGTDPVPQVDMWVVPQTPGERFVVCSDGLTNELTDDEIAAVALSEDDPVAAADRLMSLAIAAGARDNTSVIVVDVLGEAIPDLDEKTLPHINLQEP